MTNAPSAATAVSFDLQAMQASYEARLQRLADDIIKRSGRDDIDATVVQDILRIRSRLGPLKKMGTADIMACAKEGTQSLAALLTEEKRKHLFTPKQQAQIDSAASARKPSPLLDSVFGSNGRVYLPIPATLQSETQREISDWLGTIGYRLHDYAEGHAQDAKGAIWRIGKLMAQHGIDSRLKKEFENDPTRNRALMVVISRDPVDIARMSAGRGWHSCLSQDDTKWHTVPRHIENDGLVAYVTRQDDPNIEAPLARIRILPYTRKAGLRAVFNPREQTTRHDTVYLCAPQIGYQHDVFTQVVENFCAQHLNHGRDGTYRIKSGIFADVMPITAHKKQGQVMPPQGLF